MDKISFTNSAKLFINNEKVNMEKIAALIKQFANIINNQYTKNLHGQRKNLTNTKYIHIYRKFILINNLIYNQRHSK